LLRDADTTFDQETKETYRAFLGTKVRGSPAGADATALDAFYDRACHWLRENTRDKKKFGVLFEENITYGYRRNMLGLRLPSIVIDAVIILGSLAALVVFAFTPTDLVYKLGAVAACALLHIAFMALMVTDNSVRDAADQYGRQLLLSCESLGGLAPKKPPAKRKAA
jgi:hypothetical protein